VCEDSGVLTVQEGFCDEMLAADGSPRPHTRTLMEALSALGPDQLAALGAAADAGAQPGRVVGPAATATADLALARIAHELCWIGRQLARAEHTARMLDGAGAELSASVRMQRTDPAPARA
jgi:hypothetical protein